MSSLCFVVGGEEGIVFVAGERTMDERLNGWEGTRKSAVMIGESERVWYR